MPFTAPPVIRAVIAAGLLALHAGGTIATPVVVEGPAAAMEPDPARLAQPPSTARSWRIEDFRAEIHVKRSGEIDVTETLQVRFEGSYNGIFRTIPVQYVTPRGFTYKLRMSVTSVEDGAGRGLDFETSRERHYRKIKIWVPGASDAVRTVVIRYTVENGLRFFEEDDQAWDELYWNITGDEWPVTIERASARIRLPAQVSGVRARGFTGGYRSTEESVEVRISDFLVDLRSTRPLGMHEGLTVAVAWDSFIAAPLAPEADDAGPAAAAGEYLIRRATLFERITSFFLANWPLLLPVFVFFAMRHVWRKHGKDPDRQAIVPRYEPPEGLTPSEVGVLVDNRPDLRDVTAILVDLAVRGYLVIEETEVEKLLGLIKEDEYILELRRGSSDWDELRSHERKLLRAVFGSAAAGARVPMSELENEFYKDLPKIKDRIFGELMKKRYYRRRPDHVLAIWIVVALVAGFVLVGMGLAASAALGLAPLTVILAGVLSAGIVFGFGIFMPARTIAGTRALEQILGFEEFLERVESDRFKRMITGPEMFERFLPYAMALGVEKKWAAAFSDIYREPPEWYRGAGYRSFHPTLFVNDIAGMTSHAATAMTTAPRSSGGSGFSGGGGGGFSGGGFGGGGGGAF
jgi:uncharacterized membrane protein YgcG